VQAGALVRQMRILDVVGGKWKVLILWHLSETRRFGELRRSIAGISEKMLIQQLRELESAGIVARKDHQEKNSKKFHKILLLAIDPFPTL